MGRDLDKPGCISKSKSIDVPAAPAFVPRLHDVPVVPFLPLPGEKHRSTVSDPCYGGEKPVVRTCAEHEPTLQLRLQCSPSSAVLALLPATAARAHVLWLRRREARGTSQRIGQLVDCCGRAVQAARELRIRSKRA